MSLALLQSAQHLHMAAHYHALTGAAAPLLSFTKVEQLSCSPSSLP